MESWEESGFVHSPNSVMTELVLSLGAEQEDGFYLSGSAVILNRHLALTARHVIDDYFVRNEGAPPPDNHHATFGVAAVQTLDEGSSGALWSVDKVWVPRWTDVAFLRLHPASGRAASYEWRGRCRMNALPPKVGSRVAAFGYHSGRVQVSVEQNTMEWHDRPTSTYGTVAAVFPESRDNARLPFPCFEIDARVDGGMSGGPVFNESGELCGVLISTLPASGSDDSHSSYAATLWPALGTPINMAVEGLPAGTTRTALDLAACDALRVANWERVGLTSTPDWQSSRIFLTPTVASCTLRAQWRGWLS